MPLGMIKWPIGGFIAGTVDDNHAGNREAAKNVERQ